MNRGSPVISPANPCQALGKLYIIAPFMDHDIFLLRVCITLRVKVWKSASSGIPRESKKKNKEVTLSR